MDQRVLRVPRRHLEVFAFPRISCAGKAVERNRRELWGLGLSGVGRELTDLREDARQQAMAMAAEFSRGFAGARCSDPAGPIIVTGHQPEFFHPGVWIKNHFISALARRLSGTSINVVMDSDMVKRNTFALPVVGPSRVKRVAVRFSDVQNTVPFEEAPVNAQRLRGFFEEVRSCITDEEMARAFSRFVEAAEATMPRSRTLGEFMALARRQLEEAWGITNLELPVSRLCGSDAFLRFVIQIARRREEFRDMHNEHVRAYRRARRIRTTAHPVSDLAADGEMSEIPFWTIADGGRQRLWAFEDAGRLCLTDGSGSVVDLGNDDLDALREAVGAGFRVRPRAISNAMFLRLFLGDVFVHGIGGAKYDTITDAIIRDFFGVAAPAFIVLSATAHLPLKRHDVDRDDLREIRRRIRDATWNPERLLCPGDLRREDVREMVREKRDLIRGMSVLSRGERRRSYERIHEINRMLSSRVGSARERLEARSRDIRREIEENEIMCDRDYPFVIHPEATLRRLYTFEFGCQGS